MSSPRVWSFCLLLAGNSQAGSQRVVQAVHLTAPLAGGNTAQSVAARAQKLLGTFNEIRMRGGDEGFEREVDARLLDRFGRFIAREEPVRFLLPAFPAKSPNKSTKVLGDYPDYGEELALESLSGFVQRVAEQYFFGVEFIIASDGRVFTGTWWSDDRNVDLYLSELKKLPRHPAIRFISLDDFYPGRSPDAMREALMQEYAPSELEIDERISNDDRILRKYLGIVRFNDGDRDPQESLSISRKKREKENRLRARDDMRRSDAYAALLEARVPEHVRLSVHPSVSVNKIGIRLLDRADDRGTPWHNVIAVMRDGSYRVMKRELAERAGYRLVNVSGRPHHFEE